METNSVINLTQENISILSGYGQISLDYLTVGSIISAILVITTRNPIISVLFLITLFIMVASYLITIGLSFLGLTYILVYVGGITVLFLFIIMLLNIKLSELDFYMTNSNRKGIPYGVMLGILILYPINQIINVKQSSMLMVDWVNRLMISGMNSNYNQISSQQVGKDEIEQLKWVYQDHWDLMLIGQNDISTIGSLMYTNYFLLLILAGLILLLAMIGSIVLSVNKGK